MALTLINQPSNYCRVYDTNRTTYEFYSDNYSAANFNFLFELYQYDLDNNKTLIGTFKMFPISGGTVLFNPATIIQNFLTYDFNVSDNILTDAINSAGKFEIKLYEFYGTPPTKVGSPLTTTPLIWYNGCQQHIPYDDISLGKGNYQWVIQNNISGYTYYSSNKILNGGGTDATDWTGATDGLAAGWNWYKNIVNYSNVTSGGTWTGNYQHVINNYSGYTYFGIYTNVSLTGGTQKSYRLSFKYLSSKTLKTTYQKTDGTYGLFLEHGANTFEPDERIWEFTTTDNISNILFMIPSGYLSLNDYFKIDEVNFTELLSGTTILSNVAGKFLTDTNEYRLDKDSYAYLYFLAENNYRPTRIRYQYNYAGNESIIGIGIDKLVENEKQREISRQSLITTNNTITDSPPTTYTLNSNISSNVTTVYFYEDLSYDYDNSYMYYIPIGPRQLIEKSLIDSEKWLYYKIDLLSGTTVLNNESFYVLNQCKSDKYGKYQLFWLNPHGGFDTYVFDRKNDLKTKIKRTTYKQRLQPGYNTYDAGEKVFNIESDEVITLRTNLLTTKEAQILFQLVTSPVVYLIKTYDYGGGLYPFGVPYIIVNEDFSYPNKKNEKEIMLEISIRPANSKNIARG